MKTAVISFLILFSLASAFIFTKSHQTSTNEVVIESTLAQHHLSTTNETAPEAGEKLVTSLNKPQTPAQTQNFQNATESTTQSPEPPKALKDNGADLNSIMDAATDQSDSENLPTLQPIDKEQFEQEEVDSVLAIDQENYYLELFSTTESLSEYVLSEATCKSQNCKLSFLVSNEHQAEQMMNRLIEQLLLQNDHLNISIGETGTDGTATLYVNTQAL